MSDEGGRWIGVGAAEIQVGTRFWVKGSAEVYRATGPDRWAEDHTRILIPTALGVGRLAPGAALEYRRDFA